MRTKTTLFTLIILIVNWYTSSQVPYMVKDINPGSASSNPSKLIAVNNTLFFRSFNPTTGLELWKSDGTESGTVLVKDINPGVGSSNIDFFTNVNGVLYFSSYDPATGHSLWKSDGTESGTVMVKNINPDIYQNVRIEKLISANNMLFFFADDGVNGLELWKSDGTETGTSMVKDINNSASSSLSLPFNGPKQLANVNGIVYFAANDGTNGSELWKSDGTATGTVMVKNISAGNMSSFFASFFNFNGTLIFTCDNQTNGQELWKSDGSEAGTVMVKDIFPGFNGGYYESSLPEFFCIFNDLLYFSARTGTHGRELWKSDGTEAGTVIVKDIYPGSGSGFPRLLINVNNSALYFVALNGTYGEHLWKSDGTAENTIMVSDLGFGVGSSSSPTNLTYSNGYLYFSAADGNIGRELFRTDGTAEGTIAYNIDNAIGSNPSPDWLTIVNNKLFFVANIQGTYGQELWALDTETLSIDENAVSNNFFTVYPNPTKNILTIQNISNSPIDHISITDLTGKFVIEQKGDATQINVEYLKSGLYLIQLKHSGKVSTLKFIKQ